MKTEAMAACFNEWMRRYTESPESFEASSKTTSKFLKEKNNGITPSYGQVSAQMMHEIHHEIFPDTIAKDLLRGTRASAALD